LLHKPVCINSHTAVAANDSCEFANENTNGLIRQYLPKSSSFDHVSKERIESVLNNRLRKSLGWYTPNDIMAFVYCCSCRLNPPFINMIAINLLNFLVPEFKGRLIAWGESCDFILK